MEYSKTITLRDGRGCIIRNGTAEDGRAALDNYLLTHEQTDNLACYADDCTLTEEKERQYLQGQTESPRDIQLVAVVDERLVAMAGINSMGTKSKVRHRTELGISVEKDYWNLGIGNALMEACIECAKKAGFAQIELEVISDNDGARRLYEKYGFREFGRNPKAMVSRYTGYQETILMRLDLEED